MQYILQDCFTDHLFNMMLPTIALAALTLFPTVQAVPHHKRIDPVTSPHGVYKRCGAVSKYYGQHTADWNTYKTGDWLNNWWNSHSGLMGNNTGGFAGAFGQWAMGNPDWSCRDDGSDSDCDLSLCDNRVLNNRGQDIRNTYYVLESVNRLHTYFIGIGEAFTTAALGAALSKDSWATTFYTDKDDKSVTALKEVLTAVSTIVGIGASFAGLAGPITGAVAGAGSALMSGANGATSSVVGQQYALHLHTLREHLC